MKYTSTRNNTNEFTFEKVFIKGLSDEGGLFVPKDLKKFSDEDLKKFAKLDYNNLATEIIFQFSGSFITKEKF